MAPELQESGNPNGAAIPNRVHLLILANQNTKYEERRAKGEGRRVKSEKVHGDPEGTFVAHPKPAYANIIK